MTKRRKQTKVVKRKRLSGRQIPPVELITPERVGDYVTEAEFAASQGVSQRMIHKWCMRATKLGITPPARYKFLISGKATQVVYMRRDTVIGDELRRIGRPKNRAGS